jgi:hypothetical protein
MSSCSGGFITIMGKKHNHSKGMPGRDDQHLRNRDGDFTHGSDTLKVTVSYEGHPAAIDDALHGATRETEWAKTELDKADAEIDALENDLSLVLCDLAGQIAVNERLENDLTRFRNRNESLQNQVEEEQKRYNECSAGKWQEYDRRMAAEHREQDTRIKLSSEIAAKNNVIAKLQAALTALGTGSIPVTDIIAFVELRKLSPSVQLDKPTMNPDRPTWEGAANYPFALLMGDKETVQKQVLDCFVGDPDRKEKIRAIKTLRDRSGLGLKEAKDLVEWALGSRFTDRY